MIADRGLRIADTEKKRARVADAVMSAEDFRKRTFQFGIRIIRLVQVLPKTDAARDLYKDSPFGTTRGSKLSRSCASTLARAVHSENRHSGGRVRGKTLQSRDALVD